MRTRLFSYYGGKHYLVKQLLPLVPTDCSDYVEPFVGGGSMFLALAQDKKIETAHLSDIDIMPVHCYEMCRDYHDEMTQCAAELIDEYFADPAEFCATAKQRLSSPAFDVRFAATWWMYMRLAFSGIIIYDAGQNCTSISFSKLTRAGTCYKRTRENFERRLKQINEVSKLLQQTSASISCASYADVCFKMQTSTFIFLDPPYHCSNMGYTHKWSLVELKRLVSTMRDWHRQGAKMMLTYQQSSKLDSMIDFMRHVTLNNTYRAASAIKKRKDESVYINY